jgi:hypothetical protein
MPRFLVGEMPCTISNAHLRSEYDEFLFAAVDEDGTEEFISVLSVLARLDLDPLQEAQTLAGLSAESATQRLYSLLSAAPHSCSARRRSRANAARLLARLPKRVTFSMRWRGMLRAIKRAPNSPMTPARSVKFIVFFYAFLIVTALEVGARYVAATYHPVLPAANTLVSPASVVDRQSPHYALIAGDPAHRPTNNAFRDSNLRRPNPTDGAVKQSHRRAPSPTLGRPR